jgi:hypothetical protein
LTVWTPTAKVASVESAASSAATAAVIDASATPDVELAAVELLLAPLVIIAEQPARITIANNGTKNRM